MINFSRLTSIRNLARRLGLIKLVSFRSRMASNKAKKYYETHRPTLADIFILGYQYQLYTDSAYEWMRVNAVYQDAHILDKLLAHLEPGMDFWDVGASIGAYSCLLSLKNGPNGNVYAFEPEPASRKKLEANIRLNKISNIQVYDVALGGEESQLPLLLADNITAGTHRLTQVVGEGTGERHVVNVTTMDKHIDNENLKIPGLIKIDVEGFEEQVLLGGVNTIANPHCRAIVIEMHFSIFAEQNENERAGRIANLLRQAGFIHQDWIDPSHLMATK